MTWLDIVKMLARGKALPEREGPPGSSNCNALKHHTTVDQERRRTGKDVPVSS